MPEFIAKIGTSDGTITERAFTADSKSSLQADLQQRDYLVFGIRKRSQVASLLPSFKGGAKVKTKEFLLFNQELAALVRAGLPIVACLDILLERRKNPTFRKALSDVRDQVRSGASLSEAFDAQGDLFPKIYASTLASGERSGEVASVLHRFVSYQKTLMATSRKVTSALIYPACLLSLSIVVVFILIVKVVPQFVEFYADFGAELPLITRMLIGVSTVMTDYLMVILGGVVVGVLAVKSWHKTHIGRLMFDRLKVRVPLVGGVLHRFAVTRFVRTLGTLLAGGIPLVTALGPAARAVGNLDYEHRLQGVEKKVREGGTLWQSLERTGLFSDLAVEMTKVGESTGALDDMLTNVSEFYDEEIDTRLGTVMSLLEPLMLIAMGVIVAVMMLAIYLPLMRSYAQTAG
jgi:type IV pilus assembly protein PilC